MATGECEPVANVDEAFSTVIPLQGFAWEPFVLLGMLFLLRAAVYVVLRKKT